MCEFISPHSPLNMPLNSVGCPSHFQGLISHISNLVYYYSPLPRLKSINYEGWLIWSECCIEYIPFDSNVFHSMCPLKSILCPLPRPHFSEKFLSEVSVCPIWMSMPVNGCVVTEHWIEVFGWTVLSALFRWESFPLLSFPFYTMSRWSLNGCLCAHMHFEWFSSQAASRLPSLSVTVRDTTHSTFWCDKQKWQWAYPKAAYPKMQRNQTMVQTRPKLTSGPIFDPVLQALVHVTPYTCYFWCQLQWKVTVWIKH